MRTVGRADRHDEANNHFSQVCERNQKRQSSLIIFKANCGLPQSYITYILGCHNRHCLAVSGIVSNLLLHFSVILKFSAIHTSREFVRAGCVGRKEFRATLYPENVNPLTCLLG
jgi:hypothetical protein